MERVTDRDGWPIVPGARVRIEYPSIIHKQHGPRCPRPLDGACPCPCAPLYVTGMVDRAYVDERGRSVVEARRLKDFHFHTVLAADCRVMGGETKGTRQHRMNGAALRGKRVRVRRGK